jgi:hypothetical protein
LNFLTKLFIVLHVVLSLLLTAGLIVFVNRVEEFNKTIAGLNTQVSSAQRAEQEARAGEAIEKSRALAVRDQADDELGRMRQLLNTSEASLQKAQVDTAQARQDLATTNAQLQAATSATKVAQETNKLLQEQLGEIRTTGDKLQQQNTELLTANSDLTSRLQTSLRANRDKDEQIETLQTQIADAAATGGRPAPAAAADAGTPSPVASSEVAINGVIRDVRNIGGIQYGTISVGSKDQVVKGMVFNVIEREGEGDFLGYLTVDRVEERQASGRLDGPRVADIKAGNEVRTQL